MIRVYLHEQSHQVWEEKGTSQCRYVNVDARVPCGKVAKKIKQVWNVGLCYAAEPYRLLVGFTVEHTCTSK